VLLPTIEMLKVTKFSLVWGFNNPMLFTRVLQRMCGVNSTYEMAKMENCQGFHVLPWNFCTPVTWTVWFQLFDEPAAEKAMLKSKDAIVVHFSNKLSKDRRLSINSTAAYIQMAREFCPRSLELCDEYF